MAHIESLAQQFETLANDALLVRAHFLSGTTMTGYASHLSHDRARFNLDNQNTCEPQFTLVPLADVDHFEVIR